MSRLNGCHSRILWVVELLLWAAAGAAALGFAAIKLRNWSGYDLIGGSDFTAYYYAARIFETAPQYLYDSKQGGEQTGIAGMHFLYAPTAAWLLRPLGFFSFESARRIWYWGSVMALAGICITFILVEQRRRIVVLALGLFLLAPATLDTLFLGQISALLGLLIILAIGLLERAGWGSHLLSGLMIAVVGGVKPFVLLLIVMTWWRHRWALGGGVLLGLLLFIGAGFIVAPPSLTAEFIRTILFMAATYSTPDTSPFWNQSVLAFWEKLSVSGPVSDVLQGQMVTASITALIPTAVVPLLSFVTCCAIVALTGISFWRTRNLQSQPAYAAASPILLAALLLSPITWNHYLVIVAPVYLGVAALSVNMSPSLWRLLLPLGYLLIVLQRGAVIWIQYLPVMLMTSLLTVGIFLWWGVLVYHSFQVGRACFTEAAARGA